MFTSLYPCQPTSPINHDAQLKCVHTRAIQFCWHADSNFIMSSPQDHNGTLVHHMDSVHFTYNLLD